MLALVSCEDTADFCVKFSHINQSLHKEDYKKKANSNTLMKCIKKTGPFSTKLGTKHHWANGIHLKTNKDQFIHILFLSMLC